MFPVFLKLDGRRVLLVGGGLVAAAKLRALLDAGAEVTVVAPDIGAAIAAAPLTILRRPFEPGDLARYLLRHPLSAVLPRKFKIAFEGCPVDHIATGINDIGFTARRREIDGRPEFGFRVTVAGGTSTLTRSGQVLFEFCEGGQILEVAEAIIRIFHRLGDYEHRQRNRLKFLVRALGWEGFRAEFERELELFRAAGSAALPFDPQRPPIETAPSWAPAPAPPPQALAGAESCRLAVTQSRGLGRLLADGLAARQDLVAALPGLDIKISGCPNGCGQHHIAGLGFQGSPRKVGGRPAPPYFVMLGGGTEGGLTTFGRLAATIPARRVPEAIERLSQLYVEQRQPGEAARAFFQRVDLTTAKAALASLERLAPEAATAEDFIDLGEEHAFTPEVLDGECSA